MPDNGTVIKPKFHHVNLKTTRLQEMIDWYGALVGAEVLHQYELGAWLSNDQANHRIALLAFPNFVDDPEKDAEKYAPMPTLGWERAYRSGDVVVNDPDGLLFAGRADDQIKLGGRRIELGEIDDQMLRLPGVVGAASAVRCTTSGNKLLVGYLTIDAGYDAEVAKGLLKQRMPAALVPRLAIVDELPTRT